MKPLLLTLLLSTAVSAHAAESSINISADMRRIAVVHSGEDAQGNVSGTMIIRDDEPKQITITKNKILIIYH